MATVPACFLFYGVCHYGSKLTSSLINRFWHHTTVSRKELALSLEALEKLLNSASGHMRGRATGEHMQMSHTEHGRVLGFVYELEISAVFIHPRLDRQVNTHHPPSIHPVFTRYLQHFEDSLVQFKNPSCSASQLLVACQQLRVQHPFLIRPQSSSFWGS